MNNELDILVIGLGSMGKRRIRNLRANGIKNISGFDLRHDRRQEVSDIIIVDDLPVFLETQRPDALIISVPPDVHHIYIRMALQRGIACFIEGGVLDTGFGDLIEEAEKKNILLVPSSTMYFHPGIKKIFEIVKEGRLGKLSAIIYHSGQWLPDWHVYEKVSEYYVSNRITGGAREIITFELTWLTKLLGFPVRITGFYKKTVHIEGAEDIDDTYSALLEYKDFLLNITVDVVSRHATRKMVINGDLQQLLWDWNDKCIRIFDAAQMSWETISYETLAAEDGYNKNITEQMYIEEMWYFLQALDGNKSFPNTMREDNEVLKLLYGIERSSDTGKIQIF